MITKILGKNTVSRTLKRLLRVVVGSESKRKKPIMDILGKNRLKTKNTISIGVFVKIGVMVLF
jgi:hypothetical protein